MNEKPAPAWLFDEFHQKAWNDADEIAGYESNVHPDSEAERALLLRVGVSSDDTLVDFGCGSGVLAIEASVHCRRVIAIDPSSVMLEYASTKRGGSAWPMSSSYTPAS